MNEEFECGGEWWLPDNPEEKIRGTLKFAHGEGGILDLEGNFG
ncbi:MAG: ApeA N-terminal domain 1-containing protein, partial [Candidatus Syntropharchaeales archaeon]